MLRGGGGQPRLAALFEVRVPRRLFRSEHADLVPALAALYGFFQHVPQLLLLTQAAAQQLLDREFPSPFTALLAALFRALLPLLSDSHTQSTQPTQPTQPIQPTQPVPGADVQGECVELALLFLQCQSIEPITSLLAALAALASTRGAAPFLLFLHRLLPFLLAHHLAPKPLADLLAAVAAGVRAIVRQWCADPQPNTLLSLFLAGGADSAAVLAALKDCARAFVALTGRVPVVQRNIAVLCNLFYLVVVFADTASTASTSLHQSRDVLVVARAVHRCLGSLPKSPCCDNDGALLLFELLLLQRYTGRLEPFLAQEVSQCVQCLLGVSVSGASRLSRRFRPPRSTPPPPSARWLRWATRRWPCSPSSCAAQLSRRARSSASTRWCWTGSTCTTAAAARAASPRSRSHWASTTP